MTNSTRSPIHLRRARSLRSIAGGVALLMAGGVMFAGDTLGAAPDDHSTFVPITPCRLFDTRPAPNNVGPRSEPVGPGESFQVQATGSNGNCVLPADATAIAVNATAVGASAPSWAAFYPAGTDRPLASSLNYVPGAAPTPNSIDVRLSDDGRFEVYNRFGTVHLLGDVTGYYTGDVLDRLNDEIEAKTDADAVYTKEQVDALLAGMAPASGYTDAVYTKEQVDALLAGMAPASGYTDAEIDAAIAAAVAGKADVYTKAEADGAIAGAVAGKADASDVYTKAELYSKAELDVLHQLLYTKDEVDELLITERVWTADVAGDGSKLGSGPYTTAYLGVGQYRVEFELGPFSIPDTAHPIVTAQTRCPGMTGVFAKLPTVLGGIMGKLTVDVITFDPAGAIVDCPIDVMLRFE